MNATGANATKRTVALNADVPALQRHGVVRVEALFNKYLVATMRRYGFIAGEKPCDT